MEVVLIDGGIIGRLLVERTQSVAADLLLLRAARAKRLLVFDGELIQNQRGGKRSHDNKPAFMGEA